MSGDAGRRRCGEGLLPLDLSVGNDFRPGLSSAFSGSGVALAIPMGIERSRKEFVGTTSSRTAYAGCAPARSASGRAEERCQERGGRGYWSNVGSRQVPGGGTKRM